MKSVLANTGTRAARLSKNATDPKKPARGGVMRIERLALFELDIDAERERLNRNFKGKAIRRPLLDVLDAFVALEWDRTHTILTELPRGAAEFLHPVIYEVMSKRAERNNVLAQSEGKRIEFPALSKLMGGTAGPCSRDGLAYPKFKVGEALL